MAANKGDIKTSANYDVKAQKPLDGRAVRPAKADLIKKESWSSDGSTVYVYEGMQVYVQDEKKTYYLKDITKMFASDFSGWELMGTGAGSGITEEKEVYIGSDTPPKGTKVWIDPQGTPSSPSQPSGGNKPIIFYYPHQLQNEMRDITPEQKAVNAQSYLQVTNALKNGLMPNILIPYSELLAAESLGISGGYGGYIPSNVLYIAPDSPLSEVYGGASLMISVANDVINGITILEDGTASTN